jgi:hypothetical protein
VSHGRLWVDYLRHGGWNIELNHPAAADPDGRILTFVRGSMPVLCPSLPTAVQLAEACFPSPHYDVYWKDYWRQYDSQLTLSATRCSSRRRNPERVSALR